MSEPALILFLLAGRGPEAETFARRCLAALKGVGARPRPREVRA